MTPDSSPATRWRQRYTEFVNAFSLLNAANDERLRRQLSILETAGLIQYFELTIELGRKTLAAFLHAQGTALSSATPFAVFKAATEAEIVQDGDIWMAALKDRNQMSHVYDPASFDGLPDKISADYVPMFAGLIARLADE